MWVRILNQNEAPHLRRASEPSIIKHNQATILAMETTSLADAKNRLSELIASVQGTWERVVITKNGKPAAVLIAPEDLESLIETLEVLSDPEAMAAIREARDEPLSATVTGEEAAEIVAARQRGAA